jgi:hypothetical protein
MVYSDPYIHLSVADSHINYDLPRMRGNETPYIYIYIYQIGKIEFGTH